MIRAIVLLIPPLVSLRIYAKKGHEEKNLVGNITMYAVFLLINITCMAAILYVRGHALTIIDANMNTIGFLLKYLLFSGLISIVTPLIFHWFSKISLKVRVVEE